MPNKIAHPHDPSASNATQRRRAGRFRAGLGNRSGMQAGKGYPSLRRGRVARIRRSSAMGARLIATAATATSRPG